MGTHWEQGIFKKKTFSPPTKLLNEKSKPPWVHAWAFPLAAWNFSSQKSSSLFLAWANTPCKEHTTYCPNRYFEWFTQLNSLSYQIDNRWVAKNLQNLVIWYHLWDRESNFTKTLPWWLWKKKEEEPTSH
jgi:hypothetical protein